MAYVGRILTRSPYYFVATPTTGYITQAYVDLRIWSGDLVTDRPTSPTYEITKEALTGSDSEIVFELSSLIRDYYVHNRDAYDDVLTTFADCLWVEVQYFTIDTGGLNAVVTNTYLASDGYGYFTEGYNPQPDLATDKTIFLPKYTLYGAGYAYAYYALFVNSDEITGWDNYYDGVYGGGYGISASTESNRKIIYVDEIRTDTMGLLTKIILKNGTTDLYTINFEYIEYCKFTPRQIKFYNKDGLLQVFYAGAKSSEELKTNRESYKADLGYNYSVEKHQMQNFNTNGNESITLNTDWIPESQNEIIKQILLSELIWIDDIPVNISTSSVQYKTKQNDRMINYTMTFDYSANVIQDV